MDTYITLLAIFTGLLALAIVAQAVVIVLAYLRVARLDEETKALRQQIQEQSRPILSNVEDVTANVRDRSRVILEDASAISYDARRQMEKVDRLTDELADRIRLQIIRTDELLSQALQNLEEASSTVKQNVVGPVREAAAVVQGIKAAIEFFGGRRNRKHRRGTGVDEELFI